MGPVKLSAALVVRALLGLALVQMALPKVLPLPGIGAQWVVGFVGGGSYGIIASLVGGVLLAAWGVGWIPDGLSPYQVGWLSGGAAVLSRIIAVGVAAMFGLPVHLWPTEAPGTGLVLGLAIVAGLYSLAGYGFSRAVEASGKA